MIFCTIRHNLTSGGRYTYTITTLFFFKRKIKEGHEMT